MSNKLKMGESLQMGLRDIFGLSIQPPTAEEWEEAVLSENLRALESLLTRGIDIEQKDPRSGYTALHIAVHNFKTKTLQFLITRGADLGAQDKHGRTALAIARENHAYVPFGAGAETLRILEAAVKTEKRKKTGLLDTSKATGSTLRTDDALSLAIASGDCQQVRALFDQAFWGGRKVSISWEQLKIAVQRGDEDMMKLLVTWDARAPEDATQLEGISEEQYVCYTRILRLYKLPMPAVRIEEKAAPKVSAPPVTVAATTPQTVAPPAKTAPPQKIQTLPANVQIGQNIPGRGVYIGTWTPKDGNGKSLGKVFNVFAAPQDLADSSGKKSPLTFNEAKSRIASLRNWNGHDGAEYTNDAELYHGLSHGSYNGEWFIPTRELLVGTDAEGNSVQTDNLCALQDRAELQGTFNAAGKDFYTNWYWSCTERDNDPSCVWSVRFSGGNEGWFLKDHVSMACRPVRVEPQA